MRKQIKIGTKKDVDALDQRIQRDLGIELSKYRNQEVADTFLDLLIFPKYAVWWVAQSVLISIVVYIIGFWIIDLVHVQYLIYAILGLIFFVLNGVIGGLLFLIYKIRVDITMICEFAFKIMRECVEDMQMLKSTNTKEKSKGALSLLFAGIIHIVIIPSVVSAIENKILIIGYLIKGLVRKILTLLTSKVSFEPIDLTSKMEEIEPTKLLSRYYNSIEKASNGIVIVVKVIIAVVRVPVIVAFFFTVSILSIFLLLIW